MKALTPFTARSTAAWLAVTLAASLTACGQKGPLTLPKASVEAAPASSPTPAR